LLLRGPPHGAIAGLWLVARSTEPFRLGRRRPACAALLLAAVCCRCRWRFWVPAPRVGARVAAAFGGCLARPLRAQLALGLAIWDARGLPSMGHLAVWCDAPGLLGVVAVGFSGVVRRRGPGPASLGWSPVCGRGGPIFGCVAPIELGSGLGTVTRPYLVPAGLRSPPEPLAPPSQVQAVPGPFPPRWAASFYPWVLCGGAAGECCPVTRFLRARRRLRNGRHSQVSLRLALLLWSVARALP